MSQRNSNSNGVDTVEHASMASCGSSDGKVDDQLGAKAVLHSIHAGILANILLLIGHVFGVWFGVYDFTGRSRETIAIVIYFVTFGFLIVSGFVELSLDIFHQRVIGHGRYHSGSVGWNSVISCLFISAGIGDVVAFFYWLAKDFDTENIVLLASSYVLFVMAILALGFQANDLQDITCEEATITDRVDLVANCIVLVATIMGIVFRDMDHSHKDFGDVNSEIEMAHLPIWLFSSILYVTTDVLRYKGVVGITTAKSKSTTTNDEVYGDDGNEGASSLPEGVAASNAAAVAILDGIIQGFERASVAELDAHS